MKKKKFIQNVCIALCCTSVLASGIAVCGAENSKSSVSGDVGYAITNPYSGVNWNTCKQYKADFHSHTTASDGSNTLKESVERHYELGFDIIATTDHGTSSYSWTEENVIPEMKVLLNVRSMIKGNAYRLGLLDSDGGKAENGNSYTIEQSSAGDDYYYQSDSNGVQGHKMMRVPFGIENNPTSFNNAHVNSWFVDYGNGILGGTSDYITPISNVDALGGLSVINHPGEYSGARDEDYTEDAYNTDNLIYRYKIEKFANLLNDYHSCIGIDVNSKGDYRTRFDRKLWDILLQKVVPTGRNDFAIASTDAHNLGIVDSGYTLMCMESNTVSNLRKCMENGEFFAASKYVGNVDELKSYSAGMKASSNPEAVEFSYEIDELVASIEEEIKNGGQGSKYFAGDNDPVRINKVSVNDKEDTITLSTENGLIVNWIADGKVIATGNSIDLDDYSSEIGSYVRAEVFGKGGVVYTQAFTLDYDGAPESGVNEHFVDLGKLAGGGDAIVKWLQSQKWFKSFFEFAWRVFFH